MAEACIAMMLGLDRWSSPSQSGFPRSTCSFHRRLFLSAWGRNACRKSSPHGCPIRICAARSHRIFILRVYRAPLLPWLVRLPSSAAIFSSDICPQRRTITVYGDLCTNRKTKWTLNESRPYHAIRRNQVHGALARGYCGEHMTENWGIKMILRIIDWLRGFVRRSPKDSLAGKLLRKALERNNPWKKERPLRCVFADAAGLHGHLA